MTNTVTIFGCGGAGTNITKAYLTKSEVEGIYADVEVVAVDTSESNILTHKEEYKDKFYPIKLTSGKEGSGKVRAEHYKDIVSAIPGVLLNHTPTDLNIVVCSAAGGSGSVIGPLLHAELVKQGKPVISIVIGDTTSVRELVNTNNTLLSYNQMAQKAGKPFVAHVIMNTDHESRELVDDYVKEMITSLTLLFSGNIDEIDTTDLINFLDYSRGSRHSSLQIGLAQLSCDFISARDLNFITPLSVAVIHPNDASRAALVDKFDVEYITEGYLRTMSGVNLHESVVYTTDYGTIADLVHKLKDEIDERQSRLEAKHAAVTTVITHHASTGVVDDNGMVM